MSDKNGECMPLERIIIAVKTDGVIKNIKALDPSWVKECKLVMYQRPPNGPNLLINDIDGWLDVMQVYLEQLQMLLCMEHHVFWSTVVYHPHCMDMLVSFLQEANPPYMDPYDKSVQQLYQDIRKHILIVFSRLVTNKESKEHYISKEYMRDLIYNKFIFTIPILWDICIVYGSDNRQHVGRFMDSVFTLQPRYLKDLETALVFVKEAFKYITLQVNKDFDNIDPPNLPETFAGFSEIKRPSSPVEENCLTFDTLKDLIVHLLDTVLTLRIFIEVYQKSVPLFKNVGFFLSISQLYEYAIPCLYTKLEEIGDKSNNTFKMVHNYIDMIRAELIELFKETLAVHKHAIFNSEQNVEHHVEEYLSLMMEGLSESLFMKDYNASYPVTEDIEMLKIAYPQIDTVKTDFILQAIYSNLDEPVIERRKPETPAVNEIIHQEVVEAGPSKEPEIPKNVQEESYISEVKDIFPHLGDGFILKCLQHYNFSTEQVINRLLEESLAPELQTLDRDLPIIPVDVVEQQLLANGLDRLNIFDGDQFDIMLRNDVDTSKIHVGKKKFGYKNLNEMLDDKAAIKSRSDIYRKYDLICEDEAMYSDEYDDTYADEGSTFDVVPSGDAPDDLGRPFVTPRALRKPMPKDIQEYTSSSEEEEEAQNSRARLNFCQNPEELRARREANRLRNSKGPKLNAIKSTDVAGKPKGQGQEKDVLKNRDNKEKHKSSRANHNRRQGAQWKRTRGMIPS